jgi:hypothetical protein
MVCSIFFCQGDRYLADSIVVRLQMGTGTWQQLKALPCTCPLGRRSWELADWSDVVFNKDAELLIVAHQSTANFAAIFNTGAA